MRNYLTLNRKTQNVARSPWIYFVNKLCVVVITMEVKNPNLKIIRLLYYFSLVTKKMVDRN